MQAILSGKIVLRYHLVSVYQPSLTQGLRYFIFSGGPFTAIRQNTGLLIRKLHTY